MKKASASEVSRQLGDAGYTSLSSEAGVFRNKPHVSGGKWEPRLQGIPQRGFKSSQEGESVLVRFFGRPGAESTMLSNYRNVLNNCGYLVSEQGDGEREGRTLLRVTRP